MPRYRFIGHYEHVMSGLVHGVNATLHRDGEDHGQPDGSTVVAQHGDVLDLADDLDYEHALLEPADPPAALTPAEKRAATIAAKKAAAEKAGPLTQAGEDADEAGQELANTIRNLQAPTASN